MKHLKLAWPALVALAFSGCNCGDRIGSQDPVQLPAAVAGFSVQVTSVVDGAGNPLPEGDGGSDASAWPFQGGTVKFHVVAQALDINGNPYTNINHPVAIRITPGDINAATRTLDCDGGYVEGDIRAQHVFGHARIWVRDAVADEVFDANGNAVAAAPPSDPDAGYTEAAGTSQALYFNTPTLVDLQRQNGCDPSQGFASVPPHQCVNYQPDGGGGDPIGTPTADGLCHNDCECYDDNPQFPTAYACYQGLCQGSCDNTTSPLANDFVEIDEPYTTADAGMIVTAITGSGFYVTDLSAQKMTDPNNPARDAFDALPGTFAHAFVYTYSAPNDLYVGDHLISLTGSVQEFSGDTQLDFPSWVKVDQLPTPEFVEAPTPLTLTMCGNANPAKSVYKLCSYYTSDMWLESMESGPVVIDHVHPSNVFQNCDYNGDGLTPIMGNSSTTFGSIGWGCYSDQVGLDECACEITCTTGTPVALPDGGRMDYGEYADGGDGTGVCSELSSYNLYDQWEVVMDDDHYEDGGVSFASNGTRIGVQTHDALPAFNPLDFEQPQYQGSTLRIAGMLNQVEASRPRWIIYARNEDDICCYPANYPDGGGLCPSGLQNCASISGNGNGP